MKTFREFDLDKEEDVNEINRIENEPKYRVYFRQVYTYLVIDPKGKEYTFVKLLLFWEELDAAS